MLSLSDGLLFWFALEGDGMEPAWSLSIRAPVDPSKPLSSPEMRRHNSDLLFRGYSSPVDKKTIELCCWNIQGWGRAVQDRRAAWTATERQEKNTDRKWCVIVLIMWLLEATSCFSDQFGVPVKNRDGSSDILHDSNQKPYGQRSRSESRDYNYGRFQSTIRWTTWNNICWVSSMDWDIFSEQQYDLIMSYLFLLN